MNKSFEKILEKLEELQNNLLSQTEGDVSLQVGIINGVMYSKKIVQEVAEEYNGGWIPCSERLPEPIRPVLVTLRNWMNDKYFVRVGRFHTDHWKTDEGIVENSVVIAWQPLPEPFKERD